MPEKGIMTIPKKGATEQEALPHKYKIPGTGKMVDYATYRQMTGRCETCDARMNDHPKCDACGILCGSGHLDWVPTPYRGHNLCGHCIVSWKNLDRMIGRGTTWNEFLGPQPKMLASERIKHA